MAAQKYGIGTQVFSTLRERDFVYVDKTQFIIQLLEGPDYYFLSRPRRFGKSLFLSTLEQFFLGRRDLFKGLAIDKYQDWEWEPHGVIRISFGQGDFSHNGGLNARIISILEKYEEEYGIEPKGDFPSNRLAHLISQLSKKTGKGIAVLVDEYEKPLLDTYGEDIFESNRKELASFYSALKDNTEYIRLIFITGITRFGQLNIFSGLNNLYDISLSPEFTSICGITEQEIKDNLAEGIQSFAEKTGNTVEETLQILKSNYDGYHFSENITDIYNPWSLLNCLKMGRLKSDWFTSGSPSYLFKILRKKNYDLEGLLGKRVSEDKLSGMGVEIMDPTALLYQSGYLTIKEYEASDNLYTIGLPNFEVRTALFERIIPYYLGKDKNLEKDEIIKLYEYLEKGDAERMMNWLASYFSKISYPSKIRFEREFQVLVVGIFLLIKDFRHVHCEYAMSSGITDLVVETEKYVYLFEFKLGEDAEKALAQIDFRGYALPWSAGGRKVYKIGAAFSTRNNGILSYRIEEAQI